MQVLASLIVLVRKFRNHIFVIKSHLM